MNNEVLYWSVMAGAILLGIVFTVIYYFARYYVKFDSDDKEIAPSLKNKENKKGPTDLRQALKLTREGFWGRFSKDSLDTNVELNLDGIEEALYSSDIGPQTAQRIFARLTEEFSGKPVEADSLRQSIRNILLQMMSSDKISKDLWTASSDTIPQVWMIVGVNGAGKTTTIGKLASQAQMKNKKVLIIAGDTYRAAADSQLAVWAKRSGTEIFISNQTKDPAAVSYSGLEYAKAHGFDLVIIDTAGRLHTQDHLMEELKKVKRVLSKLEPSAPDETILVVDANNGQNALAQAKTFNEALGLTGVILTKMDGTSKGGVVFGIVDEMGLPIPFIGVGEAIDDLRPFSAKEFVESII